MGEVLRSILIGTFGLSVAFVAACVLTATRRFGVIPEQSRRRRVQRGFRFAVLVQGVHFLEELATGFHLRFPEFLGLAPWPTGFFVVFNLAWIGIWLVASVALPSGARWVFVPLWFFILGMVINLIAHPLLAVRAGGYFPGLFTALPVGIVGVTLLALVVRSTRVGTP
ncbi:MAG: hypothetical protein AAF481_00505 [Acidobacteriota bacterium]